MEKMEEESYKSKFPVSDKEKFGETGRSNVFSKYQATEGEFNEI